MKDVVLKTYKKKPQVVVNVFASTVQQLMSADPQFISLKSDIEGLKIDNDAFTAAIANALRGSDAQRDIKNDCYKVVIDRLDVLAHGVNGIAKGDYRVGRAAGFDTPSERKSINEIMTPTGFEVLNNPDHTGVANAKWKSDKNAVSTSVEFQKKGETDWQSGPNMTGNSAVLTGLDAGCYYYVRIYSSGRKGLESDYTEPVMVLVS